MNRAIKTTDTIDRIGTKRRPQFHEPVATASPDPVIKPSPLKWLSDRKSHEGK